MIALIGVLVLSACGAGNKNNNSSPKNDATLQHADETEGGSMEHGEGYGFTTFELDIEVDNKDAIDVEYKVKPKSFEVEYENKLANIKVKDNEAMDEIDKLFTFLLITKDTPQMKSWKVSFNITKSKHIQNST